MFNILKNIFADAILDSYGRSCNLIWYKFLKNSDTVYINIQCFVRIIYQDNILVTSDDIYINGNDSIESFNWEEFGQSLYDIVIENYIVNNMSIVSFNCIGKNDFEILFDNNLKIQLYATKSDDTEMWRVIYNGKHYVMRNELLVE